jgi:hypothetical protein
MADRPASKYFLSVVWQEFEAQTEQEVEGQTIPLDRVTSFAGQCYSLASVNFYVAARGGARASTLALPLRIPP